MSMSFVAGAAGGWSELRREAERDGERREFRSFAAPVFDLEVGGMEPHCGFAHRHRFGDV